MKRFFCCLLVAVMLVSTVSVAVSAEDTSSSFSVMSANVAGLPIPSSLSDDGRVVPTAQTELGKLLNLSDTDIICVQEDFQYDALLARQLTNYPYRTYTSGGIPVGDGMNIFSKYPIFNVERVAWEEYFGILTAANDGLTPKGLLKCTADINGVLVDVFNIHIDAYGSESDQQAKKAQFLQLTRYIEDNCEGRPVIIAGDYNCTLHTDVLSGFYPTMIVDNGFSDAWAVNVNGGNYLQGNDASAIIQSYYEQYNGLYWGLWDSVERLLYRDGNGAILTPKSFTYENYTNNPDNPQALTDHAFMKCTLKIDRDDYNRPETELSPEKQKCFIVRLCYGIRMIFRCISLIIQDGVRLLKEKTNNPS